MKKFYIHELQTTAGKVVGDPPLTQGEACLVARAIGAALEASGKVRSDSTRNEIRHHLTQALALLNITVEGNQDG